MEPVVRPGAGRCAKESPGLPRLSTAVAISAATLEQLYHRRYAAFRRGAAAIVGDDAAHDVVQDAFARALTGRERFRAGSPEAWVWRIVERAAFDYRRARRRHPARQVDDIDPDLVVSDADPAIAAAVRALPPRRRLVVFLRYFADLGYADIARICGVSAGTVAATLAQAHADLRESLEREGVGT